MVSFLSNVEKMFNSQIELLVRGGKSEIIPVKAQAVIPNLKIEEEIFDFGGVTFGDSKQMTITLHNESEIEAKLFLDL